MGLITPDISGKSACSRPRSILFVAGSRDDFDADTLRSRHLPSPHLNGIRDTYAFFSARPRCIHGERHACRPVWKMDHHLDRLNKYLRACDWCYSQYASWEEQANSVQSELSMIVLSLFKMIHLIGCWECTCLEGQSQQMMQRMHRHILVNIFLRS